MLRHSSQITHKMDEKRDIVNMDDCAEINIHLFPIDVSHKLAKTHP